MTVGTLTLADFVLARIAEDEVVARAAGDVHPSPWTVDELPPGVRRSEWAWPTGEDGAGRALCWAEDSGSGAMHWETADHLARHDPARVLAECEAKRLLLDRDDGHTNNWMSDLDTDPDSRVYSGFCRSDQEPWPCWTVRVLALPYKRHRDYREEWRP